MDKVPLCVIGCGGMGHRHILAYKELADSGIGNIELGYYDSTDDRSGDDPLVRNSEYRFLVGYEREIARELTMGVQYYVEQMQDYRRYKRNLPPGVRKLKHTDDIYRLRVGCYRIIYQIADKKLIVLVVKVGDRKDVYRQW